MNKYYEVQYNSTLKAYRVVEYTPTQYGSDYISVVSYSDIKTRSEANDIKAALETKLTAKVLSRGTWEPLR